MRGGDDLKTSSADASPRAATSSTCSAGKNAALARPAQGVEHESFEARLLPRRQLLPELALPVEHGHGLRLLARAIRDHKLLPVVRVGLAL